MMSERMMAVAAWLLTYAAHSSLLLGGAFLLRWKLVRSAAARDLLWKLATFAALGTATIHSVVLANSARLEPLAGRWEVAAPRVTVTEPMTVPESAPGTPYPVTGNSTRTPTTDPITDRGSAASSSNEAFASPSFRLPELPGWPFIVVSLWLLGAVLCVFLLARRYRRARRRFSSRVSVTDAELLAELDRLRDSMGSARAVRLTLSDAILSPVALGKREICLPSGLLPGLTAAQRQSMLAHELAHLERRDPQWLLAFGWMEACFFFQPLIRLARRQFQGCAEQLCDEMALVHTRQPLALAQCLAEVARWLRGERDLLPYPGMAESASPLLDRVQRVLHGVREPVVVRRRVRWSAVAALAAFACVAPGITSVTRATPSNDVRLLSQAVDLPAAVRAAGNGIVRFAFATRPSVCGTGEETDGTRMFALRPSAEWLPAGAPGKVALYVWDRGALMRNDLGIDGRWTTPCNPGLTRVDLQVTDGKVQRLDLSVADPAPRLSVRDLGRVDAKAAAEYLLTLARSRDQELASRALLAAVLAQDALTITDLRAVQSDARVEAPIRNEAAKWSSTFGSSTLPQSARPELTRIADLRLSMTERLDALAKAARNGLSARELIAFYPRVPDRAMRVELIDWLAHREDEFVRKHLREIVRAAVVWEEQQAALRALGASRDAYTGAPQSALAQHVADARDGIVHLAYDARPEACGSGIDRDGAGMFALLPTDKWRPAAAEGVAAFYSFDRDDFTRLALSPNRSWTDQCQNGPVHLLLEVRDGRVLNLRVAVGNPIREPAIDTELGMVAGPEAANLLLELARRGGQTIASNAILASVMAAGEPLLYPELIRIATDLSRPERVRQTALHWVALDPTPGAAEALRRNAESLPRRDRDHELSFGNERNHATIGESNAVVMQASDFAVETALRVALDPRQPLETRKKAIEWAEAKGASPSALAFAREQIGKVPPR